MVDSRVPAFTIALTSRVKRTRVLATIGGANANIRLWRDESWIQCSFELHPDYNGYIMLHDHSDSETQESGEEVQPFEPDRPRQIVVQQGGDMIITVRHGFEVLIFNVVLHTSAESMAERLEALRLRAPEILRGNQVSPPSPQDLVMPDREECMRIRYSPVKFLGSGGFGTVQRCINVDTGKLMAVKTSSRGSSGKRPSHSCALAREIETLGALSHVGILETFQPLAIFSCAAKR